MEIKEKKESLDGYALIQTKRLVDIDPRDSQQLDKTRIRDLGYRGAREQRSPKSARVLIKIAECLERDK